MEIERNMYLERMVSRMHNGMIKIITGIRRSGKSYLLNTIFHRYLLNSITDEEHIISFAFDSADDLVKIGEDFGEIIEQNRRVDPNKFISYIKSKIIDSTQYYLLLDEVQLLGGFEAVLNGLLRKSNVDVYVTGSNSRFLSVDVITEFAGRGDEIHVLPLSFSEFFSAYNGSKEEAFDDYMTYGGLPAIAIMNSDEQKITYLNNLMKSVYLKDIIARYNVRQDYDLAELVDVLASGISTLLSPAKLSNTFKSTKNSTLSANTIDCYLSYLKDSFIISTAKRYNIKGKKYIGSPYKVYFEDLGLRNARLGFRQIEPTHIMENIIYNELRYRGYNVDVGMVEYREHNEAGVTQKKQLEIDFVANLGSKRLYIQSAYDIPNSQKLAQETRSFSKLRDDFQKIVIVASSTKPRYNENGYLFMGIKEFLLSKEF